MDARWKGFAAPLVLLLSGVVAACGQGSTTAVNEEEDTAEEPLPLCIMNARATGSPSFDLDVDRDGAIEQINVFETLYKEPFLVRWQDHPIPDNRPEEYSWAVATQLVVNAKPAISRSALELQVRQAVGDNAPAIPQSALRFEDLPLPNSYLITIDSQADEFAETGRNGTLLKVLPALQDSLRQSGIVEPNFMYFASQSSGSMPDDLRFGEQHGLIQIHAPEAWALGFRGSSNVVVAVVDMGTSCVHPDLDDNFFRNASGKVIGASYSTAGSTPCDKDVHGTYCSGIIGAEGNNGKGICGVSWDVSIMPVKFLDDTGCGDSAGASSAVSFAVNKGAGIISASWGGFAGPSKLLRQAIARADLFITAAGNLSHNIDNHPFFPASYNLANILVVGAVDQNDDRVYNRGPKTVDLSAPGIDILSTYPKKTYKYLSGTSAATAFVAGAAVLLKAGVPGITYPEIKKRLIETTRPVAGLSGASCSKGVLDLKRAVTNDFTSYSGNCPP